MTLRYHSAFVLLLSLLAVSACSKGRFVNANEYNDPQYRGGAQGYLFGDQGLVLGVGGKNGVGSPGKGDTGGALGVNAYLWRGTLDTLSFMPLASADPFGGVIITDWYQPPSTPNERFKATAYILGRELRADGVRLSVFRQGLQNGQWVDEPVSQATVGEIVNKILERARELRTQSASG